MPITSLSLSDTGALIYVPLWHAILAGKLKPGTPLREADLSEAFTASTEDIQNVLRSMQADGILEAGAGMQWAVALPVPSEVEMLTGSFQLIIRQIIEQIVARKAALSHSEIELFNLHTMAQRAADTAGEFVSSRLLSFEFPILLAAIHGNPFITVLLARTVRRILLALCLYQRRSIQLNDASFQQEILACILAGHVQTALSRFDAMVQSIHESLAFDPTGQSANITDALTSVARE
jgi:DNA-binding GntR family transcriptional regulator